jgi:hypothetical protein
MPTLPLNKAHNPDTDRLPSEQNILIKLMESIQTVNLLHHLTDKKRLIVFESLDKVGHHVNPAIQSLTNSQTDLEVKKATLGIHERVSPWDFDVTTSLKEGLAQF